MQGLAEELTNVFGTTMDTYNFNPTLNNNVSNGLFSIQLDGLVERDSSNN